MNFLYYYPEYFRPDSLIALVLGFVFFGIGAFICLKQLKYLKLFLFLGGCSVAYFSCGLDLFLHAWDEQFHALVAKNLMHTFPTPVLIKNELLLSSVESWTNSHVWLHKQPLFLWQIALSLKVFGTNEIALRIPNIIGHGLLAIFLFDIGAIVHKRSTGLLLSVLFSFTKITLVYASGMEATDHNDYMFLFYITASLWAFVKYQQTEQKKYLILLGVFSGFAVLVKWLTGLIIIGAWLLYVLIKERHRIKAVFTALLISLVVFLPWQLYCFFKYKQTFLAEMNFNNRHILEALEGHKGDWLFHFKQLRTLYIDSELVYYLIPLALIYFALNKNVETKFKFVTLTCILSVYVFFTFVQTKMPGFCLIVVPMILLALCSTIQDLITKIKFTKVKVLVWIITVVYFLGELMNTQYFLKRHTLSFAPNEHFMLSQLYEKQVILELGKHFKDDKLVFINTQNKAYKMTFYLNVDASLGVPQKKSIEKLKQEGYKIIALPGKLPDYVLSDNAILKL